MSFERSISSAVQNEASAFLYICHIYLGCKQEDGSKHGWACLVVLDREEDKATARLFQERLLAWCKTSEHDKEVVRSGVLTFRKVNFSDKLPSEVVEVVLVSIRRGVTKCVGRDRPPFVINDGRLARGFHRSVQ